MLVEQRVEGALVVLEGAVGADEIVERVVADREAEMADLEIDQLAIDEPLQGAVDDAELLQLLAVERGAVQRLPPALGVLAHRLAQLLHTDLAVADGGGDGGGAAVAEDVADAPDAEGDDEQAEQDLDR